MNHNYKRDWARKKRGYVAPTERACIVCSTVFTPQPFHPKSQTCSRLCSRKLGYRTHKSEYKERANRWRKNNPEKYLVFLKTTRSRNPELYRKISRLKQQRRIARMKMVEIGPIDWPLIVKSQEGRCWWCSEVKTLHIDHVIPVSKGGAHKQENIVGACQSCNSKKRDKLWPRTQGGQWMQSQKVA